MGTCAVQEVATGTEHACARLEDHSVVCWGDNNQGEVGPRDAGPNLVEDAGVVLGPRLVTLADGTLLQATQVSAGFHVTCAVTPTSEVWCWGQSAVGQRGFLPGPFPDGPSPVGYADGGVLRGIAQVSVGASHTCARTLDGGVLCWGSNSFGQCGHAGFGSGTLTEVAVTESAHVAAGNVMTCSLGVDERATCWGTWGPEDAGTLAPQDMGITGVQSVAVGNEHGCASTLDGHVFCWGDNQQYRVAPRDAGTMGTRFLIPVDVPGLSGTLTDLRAGTWHTCGLTSDGNLECWGGNTHAQLGSDTGAWSASIAGPFRDQGAGGEYHCGLLSAEPNVVQCWGSNLRGELGRGAGDHSLDPGMVTW